MTREVRKIERRRPLSDCLKLMEDGHAGSVVVVQEAKPIGIFTERDLVMKIARHGPEILNKPIKDVMTQPVTTILPTATVWDAITLMGRNNIRRLPVVESGKLVGIVTERDIFRLILGQQNLLLEAISESLPAATREQIKGTMGHIGLERPPARSSRT
jgi:CBS domain-containing protein